MDLIIQSIHEGNSNDIAFTVNKHSLNQAEAVAAAIAPTLRQRSNSGSNSGKDNPVTNEAEVMVDIQ